MLTPSGWSRWHDTTRRKPFLPRPLPTIPRILAWSDDFHARIVRLRELMEGIAKEVNAQKAAEGLLLPLERKKYLDGMPWEPWPDWMWPALR